MFGMPDDRFDSVAVCERATQGTGPPVHLTCDLHADVVNPVAAVTAFGKAAFGFGAGEPFDLV